MEKNQMPYDPIAPVYQFPISIEGSQYEGATKTITIEALLAKDPYFSARELRKQTLLLPDNDFGQEVAGRILMEGILVQYQILKRGQSVKILKINDSDAYRQIIGSILFAGMPKFQLNTFWRENRASRTHSFHVMWIPGDYQCPTTIRRL